VNENKPESETASPPWLWPRAAYVHVPFCASRCGYCDFAISVRREHQIELYLEALSAEMRSLEKPRPVRTLFLGGGTPTLLDVAQLEKLCRLLHHWLPLEYEHEFSIEANPSTLTAEKINALADHGVNRISLGVQSFQPELLRFLDRDHTASEVFEVVDLCRRRIDAISLDLIFGVPGQTMENWSADIGQALTLGPVHLSTYGLTYEKGTPLWKQRRAGAIRPLDEETERLMYGYAMDTLESAGFEHYEISNFALPGRRCRHNEVYWANWAHWGFGMGAAGYVNGRRHLNTRNLDIYLRKALAGESPALQAEVLTERERARETMAIQLRRVEGIGRNDFRRQTGFDLDGLAGTKIARNSGLGLLADDGSSVRLTPNGKYVADAVIEDLL
jgi:oxygen-independent coproporphyrinogen-3 oxidase